jgi:hypothetical protein
VKGDPAYKWMAIQRRKKSEALAKAVKVALTDEEVRAQLQLTKEDLALLNDLIQMPTGSWKKRRAYRYSGVQLAALKLKIASTVKPPEQTVKGEMAVQVVVNTLRKEGGYELPSETSSTSEESAGMVEDEFRKAVVD